jgi:hypothetical protein
MHKPIIAVVVLIIALLTFGQLSSAQGQSFLFLDYEGTTLPLVDFGDGDLRSYPLAGSNGPGTITIDSQDAISGQHSIRYTLNSGLAYPEWDPYNYGRSRKGVTSPRGFAREFADNPAGWQFNTYDRLEFWVKVGTNGGAADTQGDHNAEFGGYVKCISLPGCPDVNSDEAGGHHYYHFLNLSPTSTWTRVILNMHPNHERGDDGNQEQNNQPHPTGESQYNYWDAFTRFYIEFVNTGPSSYPVLYNFDGFRFYKAPYQENDDQILTVHATYVPASNRVLLWWSTRKDEAVNYDIRYAFADIYAMGWNGATPAPNGTLFAGGGGYNGVLYDNQNITMNGSTLYLAIKPQNSNLFRQIAIPVSSSGSSSPPQAPSNLIVR